MGRTGLSFDGLLLPRHHTNPGNVRTNGVGLCTRWWIGNCLKPQARKTSRLTVRLLIISMSLPEGPGIIGSVDYCGPLLIRHRGNTYIRLAFTDRRTTGLQSLQPSSQLRAQLTFSSTGILPDGDGHAGYSRATVSRFARSFRTPSTSSLGSAKISPAPPNKSPVPSDEN